MKVYKILHKPTGLYFTPSVGYGNLSITGKIYSRKPSLDYVGGGVRIIIKKWSNEKLTKKQKIICDYFDIKPDERGIYWIDTYKNTDKSDWEIIEL
jgi:hypothetical protein